MEKHSRFSSQLKQTMLAEPQNLLESYVKNSEVLMVFSGNELKESLAVKIANAKEKEDC